MTLIDEIEVDGINIKFYDGIDFNIVMNHPKDGSNGFIYFFIHSWVEEVKIHQRNEKIDSVISRDHKMIDIDNIDNNYISIYQTSGETMSVYNVIREKVDRRILTNFPWLPIAGVNKI